MANEAVSDTGPILHLHEINKIVLLSVFQKVLISQIIKEELTSHGVSVLPKNIKIEAINKDQTLLLAQRYDLELGESSGIWLCKSLKINLFLTDDLDAREVASALELKPVGSLGIIIRSYREKLIAQKEAISLIHALHENSSLFVTGRIVNYTIAELKKLNLK